MGIKYNFKNQTIFAEKKKKGKRRRSLSRKRHEIELFKSLYFKFLIRVLNSSTLSLKGYVWLWKI